MNNHKVWLLTIFFGLPISTNAQKFRNLNFKQLCDTSKTGLCYWNLASGGKGSVLQDSEEGNKCMLLQGVKDNSVCWAEHSSEVNFSQGMQILTVTAFISTGNVEDKGSGFNINLDGKEGNFIGLKDMSGVY